MRIALLQLSDLHISIKENPVLKRIEKLFNSIRNAISGADHIHIVVTGDVAFSGRDEEYQKAEDFINRLRQLIADYSSKAVSVIVIPGNHDCNFDKNKEISRKYILEGLQRTAYADLDAHAIDLCTAPQNAFYDFIERNGYNTATEILYSDRLLTVLKFQYGDCSVIFDCYNTAWHSLLHEDQGSMAVPIKYFDKKIFKFKSNVIISLIHHPLNWQNPINSRELRNHLDKYSDFVLSGHEHEEATYSRMSENEFTYYVEAGALQEMERPTKSEFAIIEFDFSIKEFRVSNYRLSTDGNIYERFKEHGWQKLLRNPSLSKSEYEISDNFVYGFLLDPGSKFYHSQVDEIYLDDIFVYPNLRKINTGVVGKNKPVEVIRGYSLFERIKKDEEDITLKLILIGDEGSGKTTFLKYIFNSVWKDGYIPIYIRGDEINIKASLETFQKRVSAKIVEQYSSISNELASQIDRKKIVILLDDFQLLKGSGTGRAKFMHLLNSEYKYVVITGNSQIFFEPFTTTEKEFVDTFEEYEQYWITELGKDLRYKLIDKWNKLGRVDIVPKNDILRLNDEVMQKVDSIIGKNFLPPYPIYVLTIIQSLENASSINPEYSLQGYYYDFLISESMNKAILDKESISFYYNFSSEYVFFLFNEGIRTKGISYDSFEKFYSGYSETYQINVSAETVLANLIRARILKIDENKNIYVAYRYIYYFFIARYLSVRIHNQDVRLLVHDMCTKLYREEYSNVILFLVHLSHDPIVLDEIHEVAKSLFTEYSPCRLEGEVEPVNALIDKLPDQVIELIEVEKARQIDMEHKASLEESASITEEDTSEEGTEDTSLDIIGKMFFAQKAIDILGQVTKKHWGDLPGEKKYQLAEQTYLLGLRTLACYLQILGSSMELLAEHIKSLVATNHITQRDKIEQFSKDFTFRLSFMASYGLIKRISNAIGYGKLNRTFDELLNKMPYTSVELIDLSIRLDHYKSFPIDTIEKLKVKNHKKNYLAYVLLQNLVISYLYMFDTSYQTKQRLSQILDIKIVNMMAIDSTSRVKRE